MISFSRHLATSQDSQSTWGRLPPILRKYRKTPILASSSSWHFSLVHNQAQEFCERSTSGVVPLALASDYLLHTSYIFHTLPYLCWRAWGHRNIGPGWSRGSFALNGFLHGTAKQTWEPVTQGWRCNHQQTFHHPSSRKLSFSVLNQACFCGVYRGSHLAKGHGNKAAVRVSWGQYPRAACLVSLLALQFPQAIIASPLWCLQQRITATCLGAHIASSSSRLSCPYLILFPPKLMSPFNN
jgi:hypothetical protein